jgi:hypothetical protein
MKSRTTKRFRELFAALPKNVQDQARAAYRLFLQNPHHPSLRFKKVHPSKPMSAFIIEHSASSPAT